MVAALLVMSVAVMTTPPNVLSNTASAPVREAVGQFFPQGWSFFTRDPQGPYYYGFHVDEYALEPVTGSRSWAGLDRSPRLGTELVRSVGQSVQAWEPCESDTVDECASTVKLARFEQVDLAGEQLCGRLVVVRHSVTPWAWLDLSERLRLDAATVEISCEN